MISAHRHSPLRGGVAAILQLVEDLGQDLRSTLREMRRTAGITWVALFSLALGIGAATAAFSLMDAFLLRALSVPRADGLVAFSTAGQSTWAYWPFAPFSRWRQSPDALFHAAAASDVRSREVSWPSSVERREVSVSVVSWNYFDVMGVALSAGSGFGAYRTGDLPGPPVAIISDAFWSREFGRAPDVLTKTVGLDGIAYQIVGVARRGFSGHVVGHPVDVWLPIAVSLAQDHPRPTEDPWGASASWLHVIARLPESVSVEQAAASANVIYQRFSTDKARALGAEHPAVLRDRGRTISLLPAATGFSPEGERFRRPLTILTGFSILVLLVACANFTNLMLARSEARRREFAIRRALGAGRWRLVRQSATECAALTLVGTLLGLLFARWAATLALEQFALTIVPVDVASGVDGRVLGFTAACAAIAMAFGSRPGILASRSAEIASVQPTRQSGAEARGRAARRVVLIAQLTLCTVLLIGTGLLLRTVWNLRHQDLGFDRNVIFVSVSRPGSADSGAAVLMQQVRERLLAVHGVEAAGLSGPVLLDSAYYWVDGANQLTTDSGLAVPDGRWTFAAVGSGFFDAMGMRVVRGRALDDRDLQSTTDAIVVNRSLATFLFGREDVVGRRIRMRPAGPVQTVVGVVNDVKQTSPRDRGMGVLYVPLRRFEHVVLAVRSVGAPAGLALPIRSVIAGMGGGDACRRCPHGRRRAGGLHSARAIDERHVHLSGGAGARDRIRGSLRPDLVRRRQADARNRRQARGRCDARGHSGSGPEQDGGVRRNRARHRHAARDRRQPPSVAAALRRPSR